MTTADVWNWLIVRIDRYSPQLAVMLKRRAGWWQLSDGTAAAGYVDGLLHLLDGWELEDLSPAVLAALAAAAPSWDTVLSARHRAGWAPAGDRRDARSAWVQRIRVQLGLAITDDGAADPGEGAQG